MKTRNGFLFQFKPREWILAFVVVILSAQIVSAKPLEPLNLIQYLLRLNELRYSSLDPKTVKLISTQYFQGCVIDETQFEVRDPVTNISHNLQVAIYRPAVSVKLPAVIIIPTILGRTVIENSVAYRFCMTNMVSVIADVNSTAAPASLPDWEMHDRMNRSALIDLRTLLDLLESHPQVDAKKIAGYGLSLGGFTMSLLAAVDSRIKAVALIATAGNMPAILTNSQQKFPVRLREMRMKAINNTSLSAYEDYLRANINYDPILMARTPATSKYFMLMNLDDVYVPAENQLELWSRLGNPEHLDVRASHDQTILGAVTVHFNEILNAIVARLR